jgi:hypothetical protein
MRNVEGVLSFAGVVVVVVVVAAVVVVEVLR